MTAPGTRTSADSSRAEVDDACRTAAEASREWEDFGRDRRAQVLDAMADALHDVGDAIIACADKETALGVETLTGELKRTTHQLHTFADTARAGAYLEAVIEHAKHGALGSVPDLRKMLVPIGPVAVFGASNFPLAFSVPGGDTASALAAGCPVVVKAHPSHPETSVLALDVLTTAARRSGAPADVLTLVHGTQAGVDLVQHPTIRAVAFTGSLAGGRALADLAAARPDPIPFYGELGAANVVVVTSGAAQERGESIGADLAVSFTSRGGQMCTKPGLAFVPAGPDGDQVCAALTERIGGINGHRALNPAIEKSFAQGVATMTSASGVAVLAGGSPTGDGLMWPAALTVPAADFDPKLAEECFGPLLLVVRYEPDELGVLLEQSPNGLTATVHAGSGEQDLLPPLERSLRARAGRLVWNGYPTGVAVSPAMTHGGPWPATNTVHTSVGAASIRRFLRPVTWQNAPTAVLPHELRDGDSPVPRRVDGEPESGSAHQRSSGPSHGTS